MSKINFLVLTGVEAKNAEGEPIKLCTNCGDPNCTSVRVVVHARLFEGEDQRPSALSLLDGNPLTTLGKPMGPTDDDRISIGTHFFGGNTIVFEVHQLEGGHLTTEKFQIIALMQSAGLSVVWHGPRTEDGLDPVAYEVADLFSYAPDEGQAATAIPPAGAPDGPTPNVVEY